MLLFLFLQTPMINNCTNLPIIGYRINITVTFMDGSIDHYTSKFIDATEYGMEGMFNVSFCDIFDELLEDNARYNLTAVIPLTERGKLLIYTYLHNILCLDTFKIYAV